MRGYAFRRLLWFLPVAFLAATIVFFIMRVAPGDAALAILSLEGGFTASPEEVAELRARLGTDQPLLVQYTSWLSGLVHLDLGKSHWTGQSVISEIALRLPPTLYMIFIALVLSVLMGIPIGLLSAFRQDQWVDYILRGFAIGCMSIPGFWIGIMLILTLLFLFQWYPPLGYSPVYKEPLVATSQLFFPALVLSLRQMGVLARMMRSCMLEVIREDYVRTARAKGLAERVVLWVHALRNAMLPVVSVLGIEAVVIFSGAVIAEVLFNVPGVGSFLVDSIHNRDIPVMQGIILVVVLFVLLINLVVDFAYAWLDPRIRYS
ncbi:MAG: ABC transporter permease [Chloroflexota bacterium]